jgi:hypothetical protein
MNGVNRHLDATRFNFVASRNRLDSPEAGNGTETDNALRQAPLIRQFRHMCRIEKRWVGAASCPK